jgi:glycosyltransferase involved in cell wall biosynthesis
MIVLAANFDAVRSRIEAMFGRVPAWVELLPPTDNVAAYYRMAEVFISPSREEGLPYALIEAAYCGLRLVASDIGGQTALGIPGLAHFESEDPRGLYEALKAGNSTPAVEARDYVVKRFRLEKWVRDIVGLYSGLPSRGGALPRYRTP